MYAKDRWFLETVEVITVGFPFCAFKLLTGQMAIGTAPLAPLGYALLVLGAVDLVLNSINLVSLVAVRRRVCSACLAELVLRRLGQRTEIGLAVDMFLSFALVAAVVGLGLIPRIHASALWLWNLGVVLNVMGAGIGRMITAFQPVNER